MRQSALKKLGAGLCVLPAIATEKRASINWKLYQSKLPTTAQVTSWFSGRQDACCIVTGQVSGGLEMIDFDSGGESFIPWFNSLPERLSGRLLIERSPSGGYHAVYRSEAAVGGNMKLAERHITTGSPDEYHYQGKSYVPRKRDDGYVIQVVLIETRGEGGLFLCAPTPGYMLLEGDFDNIPTFSAADRDILLGAARGLNEIELPELSPPADALLPIIPDAGNRPGDAFNRDGDIRSLLRKHGWKQVRGGENEYWRRPGKTSGWSATLRGRQFYVHSSNAAPFEPEQYYTPFCVFATLECDGDMSLAASKLNGDYHFSSDDQDQVDLSLLIPKQNGDCFSGNSDQGQSDARDDGKIDPSLLRVPGFVGELMDYNLATAPYPNIVLAFCGAMAMQSFLAGRKVCDPGDNRTNLYLLGLAHPGAGKDWPRKTNAKIIHDMGMMANLGDSLASGEGLQDSLYVTPNMLFQTDEIDTLINAISKSPDGRHESLISMLLMIFSSANSVVPMRRKAGQEQLGAIDQPHLTIFGTAIPEHYYESLSERLLTNGFFARTIILESFARGAGQEPDIQPIPDRVMETATWWLDSNYGAGNLTDIHPRPRIVPQSDGARALLRDHRRKAEEHYGEAERNCNSSHAATWSRANESVRKLALLYALSESPQSPEIGVDAVRWATEFIDHQVNRMLLMSKRHMITGKFEEYCVKMLNRLRGNGGVMSHSKLLRYMRVDARTFRSIVGTLYERNEIEAVSLTNGGQAYRLSQVT